MPPMRAFFYRRQKHTLKNFPSGIFMEGAYATYIPRLDMPLFVVNMFAILLQNILCIPESFNTNISNKLFDYNITYARAQIKYSKTGFKRSF